MCGKTRRDKIRNYNMRESWGSTYCRKKMVETRLRWFGHVGRCLDFAVRRVDQMKSGQIISVRGRPRKTIRETIKKDLEL